MFEKKKKENQGLHPSREFPGCWISKIKNSLHIKKELNTYVAKYAIKIILAHLFIHLGIFFIWSEMKGSQDNLLIFSMNGHDRVVY